MKQAKHLPFLIISAICLLIIGYGYWGAFTKSGQYYYDEMDAMYPFFALVISSGLFFITLIWWIIRLLKKS